MEMSDQRRGKQTPTRAQKIWEGILTDSEVFSLTQIPRNEPLTEADVIWIRGDCRYEWETKSRRKQAEVG